MSAITIPRDAEIPLEIAQYIRNGRSPTTEIQNRIATLAGSAAYVHSKLIYRSAGQLCSGGSSLVLDSLATRPRWRFAFHTGPFAWYLLTRFEIAPQNNGTATDPYCELRIYNTSNVEVGRATMHGGSSDGSYADVPINMTGGVSLVLNPADLGSIAELDPDTEYTGVFWDVGYARLQSASCWEVSLEPDTDNGYAANNLGAGSPIYSSHRDDVAAMARLLHKRSGTPVFHWCSNVDSAAPSQASGASTGAASLTLGALSLSASGVVGGTGVADMTLGAMTVAATGTTAVFTVIPSSSDATVPHSGAFNPYVDVVATPAQTNGYFAVKIGPNVETDNTVVSLVEDEDLDGWTNVFGWAVDANYWIATFSLSAPSGASQLSFRVSTGSLAAGHVITITTNGGTVGGVAGSGIYPATDQVVAPDSSPVSVPVT